MCRYSESFVHACIRSKQDALHLTSSPNINPHNKTRLAMVKISFGTYTTSARGFLSFTKLHISIISPRVPSAGAGELCPPILYRKGKTGYFTMSEKMVTLLLQHG